MSQDLGLGVVSGLRLYMCRELDPFVPDDMWHGTGVDYTVCFLSAQSQCCLFVHVRVLARENAAEP